MQAVVRGAITEAARGFSTGLVVWASNTPAVCNCACPEQPRCPDCICQGSERVCRQDTAAAEPGWWLAVAAAAFAGFLAGYVFRGLVTVVGRPVPREDLFDQLEPQGLDREAAAQLSALRSRRHGGQ